MLGVVLLLPPWLVTALERAEHHPEQVDAPLPPDPIRPETLTHSAIFHTWTASVSCTSPDNDRPARSGFVAREPVFSRQARNTAKHGRFPVPQNIHAVTVPENAPPDEVADQIEKAMAS